MDAGAVLDITTESSGSASGDSSTKELAVVTTTQLEVAITNNTHGQAILQTTIGNLLSSVSNNNGPGSFTSDITTVPVLNEVVKDDGLSPAADVGIVLAVLLLLALVGAVIIILWRKRNGDGEVRVWQENSVHAIPDLNKKRSTTWHEDETDDHSDFNPDLELQPVNIFRDHSAFPNSDDDSSVFTDSTQMPSTYRPDKTNGDGDNKYASTDNKNKSESNATAENDNKNSEHDVSNKAETQTDIPMREGGSVQYAVVNKKSNTFKVANEKDKVNIRSGTSSDASTSSTDSDTDDEEVIVIGRAAEKSNKNRQEDYTNVDIIRRVQSVHASNENTAENADNVPKRALSEVKASEPKRPVPFPRRSKKKRTDRAENYDYPPLRALSDTQVGTFMSSKLPPGYEYVDESKFIANRDSQIETDTDTAEDVYDVPRGVSDADVDVTTTEPNRIKLPPGYETVDGYALMGTNDKQSRSDTEDNVYEVPDADSSRSDNDDRDADNTDTEDAIYDVPEPMNKAADK